MTALGSHVNVGRPVLSGSLLSSHSMSTSGGQVNSPVTFTTLLSEAVQTPSQSVTVTAYVVVEPGVTVIDGVVAPFDHK